MSTSSDGTRNEASLLSAEATGVDLVEEAREKMNVSIINVNQFYPEITGGIKVYNDKFSFLADNAADIPVEKMPSKPDLKEEERSAEEVASPSKEGTGEKEEEKGEEKGDEKEGEGKEEKEEEEREGKKEEEREEEQTSETNAAVEGSEEVGDGEEPKEKSSSKGDDAGVFSTELETGALSSATTNLLFLPEHWSSRTQEMISLSHVISNSTAEHYKAGQIAAKLSNWDSALAHFNKCVKLSPHEAAYYIRRAEIFLTLCDFASAILNYKRACILEPTNRDHFQKLALLYLLHGQALFDQKLYPEALESFSRAAEMQPERVAYQTRSLACLAALQRHGECLALVNKRLEADTSSADLYVMRARLHRMFRNYSLCYYDLKDALSIDAAHVQASLMLKELADSAQEFNARAVELALSGRTREALQRVSLAIEMDPTIASFHVKRGAFQRRLGDYNAAIDDYLLALDKTDHDESSPIYAEAQRQLLLTFNDFAVECFAKSYYEEAIVLLNKAIKAEKNEKGLYVNRGDCFYRQGDLQFALADFHQALELAIEMGADDGMSIHARIALVHHRLGQDSLSRKALAEAVEQFSLAIKHNPWVSHFWMARARVRYTGDRNAEGARRDVAAALLLRPGEQDPEDGSMSLVSRLFPGQTLTEVTSSPTAAAARKDLETAVRGVLPEAVVTVSQPERGSGAPVVRIRHRTRRKGHKPRLGTIPTLRECASERDMYAELVDEKRELAARVKAKQRARQSLKTSSGKVLPMGAASELVRRGGLAPSKDRLQQEVLLNDEGQLVGRQGEVKGWRTFSLGVGSS